jgi:DNA-binding GntR family transcriptional regulator
VAAKDAAGTVRRARGLGVRTVYETLKRNILDLTLAPGSPIDEVQLAKRFSMSRTPVREALVRLASEGLVTTLPNRNTIVSVVDFAQLPVYFDALALMYRVTTRAAGVYRTTEDLKVMRLHQDEFARSVEREDALGMIASNRDFHVAIAAAGRNSYYTAFFTQLLDEGRRILRLYYSSFNDQLPRRFVQEHEDILAAVEARDIERCDRLAIQHGDQIVRQIQSYLARDMSSHVKL